MKTKNLISLGKAFAIAILILGIIHDVATYSPLIQDGLTCLSQADLSSMLYMSLICGSSYILCGILLLILFQKTEAMPKLFALVFSISIFLAISGIMAASYMPSNPFAWTAMVLTISMLLITLGLYRKRKNNES